MPTDPAAGVGVLAALGAGLVSFLLVFTGELFRLNIEAQKLLDQLGLNFFNDV